MSICFIFYFARCRKRCGRATFFYILLCKVLKKVRVGNFYLYSTLPGVEKGVGGQLCFLVLLFHVPEKERAGLFFTFIFRAEAHKGRDFFLHLFGNAQKGCGDSIDQCINLVWPNHSFLHSIIFQMVQTGGLYT